MSTRRMLPSAASWRSTTIWVAMPAWSVPGTHSVAMPRMRAKRASTSCSVLFSAWPMWSEPVTFGGGMTMVKVGAAGSSIGRERPAGFPRRVEPGLRGRGVEGFVEHGFL